MDSRLPSWINLPADDETSDNTEARTPNNWPRSPPRASVMMTISTTATTATSPTHKRAPNSPMSTATAATTRSESLLVGFLREQQYDLALELLQKDPNQAAAAAAPILLPPNSPNNSKQRRTAANTNRFYTTSGSRDNVMEEEEEPLLLPCYYPTALGVYCEQLMMTTARDNSNNNNAHTHTHTLNEVLLQALIQACPLQLRCSQRRQGHTPLRQVIHLANRNNQELLCKLVLLLLRADADYEQAMRMKRRNGSGADGQASTTRHLPLAALQRDEHQQDPLDRILWEVQSGTIPVHMVMELVQAYMEHLKQTESETTQQPSSALLVRFFSLGTSIGYIPGPTEALSAAAAFGAIFSCEQTNVCASLARIHECTRALLRWQPSLLYAHSPWTECSPLHVALRNYGNYTPLILELLQHDDEHGRLSMQHRNIYGDLPVHVACAVGVPLDLLHTILAKTLASSTESSCEHFSHMNGNPPHSLIWSKNLAGYTPIDLEWIRHIEAGNGFFSHRSFCPLDTRGIRIPSGRDAEFYNLLLRQAVDQIISDEPVATTSNDEDNDDDEQKSDRSDRSIASHLVARVDWTTQSNRAFGLLLHRIFLIIRATFHDSFSTLPVDLTGDILHLATSLITPTAPSLPRPIGELIRWQYPEELKRQDHLGRLPLHCCLGAGKGRIARARITKSDDTHASVAAEWCVWVKDIIRLEPWACHVSDNSGRIPLHYALELLLPDSSDTRCTEPILAAISDVIETLLNVYPESVEIEDPVTGLFPFLLASSNPSLPLDVTYTLLKRAPGATPWACNKQVRRRKKRQGRKRSLSSESNSVCIHIA